MEQRVEKQLEGEKLADDESVLVLGEDVGAWIVLSEGATVTAEELREFCAERLSDYKVPRRWTFMSELPRNPTGKVLKRDLQ